MSEGWPLGLVYTDSAPQSHLLDWLPCQPMHAIWHGSGLPAIHSTQVILAPRQTGLLANKHHRKEALLELRVQTHVLASAVGQAVTDWEKMAWLPKKANTEKMAQ